MQISLSSGDYRIVSSGQTFLFGFDQNLKIDLIADNGFAFSIILEFKTDSDGKLKIDKQVKEREILLTCFNFEDTGTGFTKPVRIAWIEGQEVFFMFWSYLEGSKEKVRSVKYTIFISDNLGDHVDGNE